MTVSPVLGTATALLRYKTNLGKLVDSAVVARHERLPLEGGSDQEEIDLGSFDEDDDDEDEDDELITYDEGGMGSEDGAD
jgi:hypothetical protein